MRCANIEIDKSFWCWLFSSGLSQIPVFWSSETDEAKNCLSQLHIQAQPAKTDRRVFFGAVADDQNAWDLASAAAFFGTFFVPHKKVRATVLSTRAYQSKDKENMWVIVSL